MKEYYLIGSSANEKEIAKMRQKACKTSDGATVIYPNPDSDFAIVYARYDNIERGSLTNRLYHLYRKLFATRLTDLD